jgi:chorismate dehydratase
MLLPDLGIVGLGAVGSVILFGSRNLEMMRDIALPSDSSTSKVLLRWLLNNRGLDPKCIETGPDLDSMLQRCDGALLIGDRALVAAESHPDMIRLDLGREWKRVTGLPMVFGVFACRRDAPKQDLLAAHADLIRQYHRFENDEIFRTEVITKSAKQVGAEEERIARYFQHEVRNLMDAKAKEGLLRFLSEVCGMTEDPVWFSLS